MLVLLQAASAMYRRRAAAGVASRCMSMSFGMVGKGEGRAMRRRSSAVAAGEREEGGLMAGTDNPRDCEWTNAGFSWRRASLSIGSSAIG